MDKFFKENYKWLTPLISMLLVISPTMISEIMGLPLPLSLPTWLLSAATALCMMVISYGILVTDTLAARIAAKVIPAILLAMIAIKVFA